MKPGRVDAGAVILAAGLSSRFGGFPKALAEINGRTLLSLAVEKCRLVGVDRIVVVTGRHKAEVARAAKALDVETVHNPDYERGMFGSVKTGIKTMAGIEAFFVWPVDSVLARPQTLLSLLTAWRKAGRSGADITALLPVYQNLAGHPPLINSRALEKILNWEGGGGLRGWLASMLDKATAQAFERGEAPVVSGGSIVFLPLPDEGLIGDIDTRADLDQARARQLTEQPRPSLEEAWQLLLQYNLDRRKLNHSRLVAVAAFRLALALGKSGLTLDPDLALLGGLLHDLAYNRPRHAVAGRDLANDFGWSELGLVIGSHTEPPPEIFHCFEAGPTGGDGKKVSARLAATCLAVYLADKYCQDDKPVTLKTRFDQRRLLLGHDPGALSTINSREKNALEVESRFRRLLGVEPSETVRLHTGEAGENAVCHLHLAIDNVVESESEQR